MDSSEFTIIQRFTIQRVIGDGQLLNDDDFWLEKRQLNSLDLFILDKSYRFR